MGQVEKLEKRVADLEDKLYTVKQMATFEEEWLPDRWYCNSRVITVTEALRAVTAQLGLLVERTRPVQERITARQIPVPCTFKTEERDFRVPVKQEEKKDESPVGVSSHAAKGKEEE